MALLAEELVEEWLNRSGFFTIRGIKLGVHEMDLLAIRHSSDGIECRHIEVQASVNPVSYLFRLSKEAQRETGRGATSSAIRSLQELEIGASEWVSKKFDHPEKQKLKQKLVPCTWTRELVVHKVKHEEELLILKSRGITIHRLTRVVSDLATEKTIIPKASGGDFLDLVHLGSKTME